MEVDSGHQGAHVSTPDPKFGIGDFVYSYATREQFDVLNANNDVFGVVRRRYWQDDFWWYDVYIGLGKSVSWRREDRLVSRAEWDLIRATKGI